MQTQYLAYKHLYVCMYVLLTEDLDHCDNDSNASLMCKKDIQHSYTFYMQVLPSLSECNSDCVSVSYILLF